MNFFYSFSHSHLAIWPAKKIPVFRTKPASLCKGWRGYVIPAEAGIREKRKKGEENQKRTAKNTGRSQKD